MSTQPPKKRNPSWNTGDDVKLFKLFEYRKADPNKNDKKYLEPIREKYFPQINYKNFRVNWIKKSSLWRIEQELKGKNRPRKFASTMCFHSQLLH